MTGRLLSVASAMILVLSGTTFAWLDAADPAVVTVLNTQDTQFAYSSPDSQSRWLRSYGASSTTQIRGWQDITALDFALAGYRGQIVAEAELHLAKADTAPVFALVASTINTDWQEGGSTGGNAAVGDPCWRWRRRPANTSNPAPGDEWTFRYGDVSTVTFGNYGTKVCYAYTTEGTFGTYTSGGRTWLRMRLDPDMVQALILDQHGLVVTDSRMSTYTSYSPAVYTKESGADVQPRLRIRFAAESDTTGPCAVSNLQAEAGPENGEVILHFDAASDPQAEKAFGYTVRHSIGGGFEGATDVARWRIPRPKLPGQAQRVLLEDLAPGVTYTFFVQAYDLAGNGGPVQSVVFTVPAAEPTPTLPDGAFVAPNPAGKTVREVPGVLRYWAASEVAKINPVTGNRIEDGYTGTGADNYKKANVVWDSASNTITLAASRNEVVGAQIILERLVSSLSNVHVAVSDLVGPAASPIPAGTHIELFQLHYVTSGGAWYPDAAIPLTAPFATEFSIPDAYHNASGVNQSVWMDIYVPKNALPVDYRGTITVTAAELPAPVTINLCLSVGPLTIPDYPTFLVDYNGYNNHWDFLSDTPEGQSRACLRYFQAAHKHRAVCNTLPYGWSTNIRPDRAPTLTGAGATLHADDWSVFDAKYGRFFDGSAFLPTTPDSPYYGPGMGTPITHLYTTFFESWPIRIMDTTYGFDPTTPPLPGMPGLGGPYWNTLNDTNYTTFFATMPDIYPGFPDSYKQGVVNVIADWFRHARDKGWTRTAFQIYLNHKYYYEGCPVLWELEEVESADDFRAVGYFHKLYREGQRLADAPEVKWHFRIDISDRWSQNWGQIDNLINLHMKNHRSAGWCWRQNEYRNYHLDADRQEQWMWYNLGAQIPERGTGHSQVFLQKWCQGYMGGLPYWDNFDTSWTEANHLCTMYSGENVPGFGRYEGPIMSIRAKMMRQGQQIIELLNAWSDMPGLTRPRVRDALNAKYGSGTWDYAFTNVDEVALYRMRADLAAKVQTLAILPGDANGDGYVNVGDLQVLVAGWGKTAGEPGFVRCADFTGDNYVNIGDLQVLVSYWGQAAGE